MTDLNREPLLAKMAPRNKRGGNAFTNFMDQMEKLKKENQRLKKQNKKLKNELAETILINGISTEEE